jgi:hypothetical protein
MELHDFLQLEELIFCFPLIRHGKHRKVLQRFLPCSHGKVFTELLLNNSKGIHKETHRHTCPTILLYIFSHGTCMPSHCLASNWRIHLTELIPGSNCRLRSSGSETGSTQPREYNWGATTVAAPVKRTLNIAVRDPPRWLREPLYPQTLALTSPRSGGRSVSVGRLRTKATELLSCYYRLRTPLDCVPRQMNTSHP